MKTGIFGGTFDPVHIGHLLVASAAREHLSLDRVLIMPAQAPPHKLGRRISRAEDRAAMIEAAIERAPWLEFSDLDLQSDAPSYTADLLDRFAHRFPHDRVWFIIGEDSFADFPTWHDPRRILDRARLAVAQRPGYDVSSIQIDGESVSDHVDFFHAPLVDISSTKIRERVATSRPITWWVPEAVERVIHINNLYRA